MDIIRKEKTFDIPVASQTLAEILKKVKQEEKDTETTILCDVSGSMQEILQGKTKLQHLRNAVSDLRKGRKFQVFSFDSGFYRGLAPSNHNGSSTDLAKAFRCLNKQVSSKKILVISDGLPDSQQMALSEAKKISCRIDVIYIGPGNDSGEAFMKLLASQSGGTQTTASTFANNFGQQLVSAARLLLT